MGVRLIKIWGTECGICAISQLLSLETFRYEIDSPRTSLTGATFSEVPMIKSRSTFSRSANRQVSNSESNA